MHYGRQERASAAVDADLQVFPHCPPEWGRRRRRNAETPCVMLQASGRVQRVRAVALRRSWACIHKCSAVVVVVVVAAVAAAGW